MMINNSNYLTASIAVALVAFMIFINSLFVIYEYQQAIITQFGKVINTSILKPGLHFKIPLIQKALVFEKRVLNLNQEPREVIAMDQKRVIVDSYVKYRIVDPLKFYQTVGGEYNLSLRINPIIEAKMREEIGKVTLTNLISKDRSKTMDAIRENLAIPVKEYGIEIIDVKIKKTDLPQNNAEAIFMRMQTDRKKEAREIRAKGQASFNIIKANADKERVVMISESEKRSMILRGEADAMMIKSYNELYSKDRDFFSFMKYMDTYRYTFDNDNSYFVLNKESNFMKLFSNIENE